MGKNSRVTFIVTKAERDAKRAEQVTLPSRCEAKQVPLDPSFYTDAVVKKVAPMLSVLFAADERQARMTRTVYGKLVELVHCGFGAVMMSPAVARAMHGGGGRGPCW